MNSISKQMYAIVTRGTGRYYIDSSRVHNIVQLINSQNKPAIIKVDKEYVAVNDIVGIVTPSQLETADRQRKGEWKCDHGIWHEKSESQCKCNWGKTPRKSQIVDEPLTDEQKENSEILAKLRKAGYKSSQLYKLSKENLLKLLEEKSSENKMYK